MSGLTVTEVARALLQSGSAVGRRITRVKKKIHHTKNPLRVPPAELLPGRTPHVLSCIYAVVTDDYWSTAGPSAIRDEVCGEVARLAAVTRVADDPRLAHSNLVARVRADLLRRAGRPAVALTWYSEGVGRQHFRTHACVPAAARRRVWEAHANSPVTALATRSAIPPPWCHPPGPGGVPDAAAGR